MHRFSGSISERGQAGKKPQDSFADKLEEAVKEAKKNRKWRHEYMTLLMRDRENVEKGIEKGIEKGEEKLAKLIKLLGAENRIDDILKATNDKEYRQELYKEYHII